jgi:hypothetical protein
MSQFPSIKVGGWARISDTDYIGLVEAVGSGTEEPPGADDATRVRWVRLGTSTMTFVVPVELVTAAHDPAIELAASRILDLLSNYDRSWAVNDTSALRAQIAMRAVEAVEEYRRKH